MIKKSNVYGVWCRKNKTFYYLETGSHYVMDPIQRIIRVLRTKELIDDDVVGPPKKQGEEDYILMTWADAEEKNYEVEVMYLNNNVKKAVLNSSDKPESNELDGWK